MIEYQTDAPAGFGGPARGLGCSGCLSSLLAPLIGLPIALMVCGGITMSRRGSDEAAVAAFNRCPVVTAALGTPIEQSMLSLGCGEYEGGGSSGHANWSMRLVGPRGSASAWYAADYVGGQPWQIESATVDLPDGRTVTAVPCEGAVPVAPSPRPDRPDRPDRPERPDRPDRPDHPGKAGKRR